jgi:hypothetical protein
MDALPLLGPQLPRTVPFHVVLRIPRGLHKALADNSDILLTALRDVLICEQERQAL